MPADAHADLFPWILGGLLTAAGAAALLMTAESPRHTRMSAAAAAAVPLLAVPTASAAGRIVPPAAPAQTPAGSAPQSPPAGQSKTLPPGEVWQCTVDGQPVYSDAPCGKNSSIRRLEETNVMDPGPSLPNWTYQRPDAAYPPAPAEPPVAPYYDPDSNDDVYAVNPYTLVNDRSRRGHESRRPRHYRGSPDRK